MRASRRRIWWALTGAYAVGILVFAVIPMGPDLGVEHLDKLAHICEYLVFAWLLVQAIRASQAPASAYVLWAWILAFSDGLLMEVIQFMLPWREASWGDVLANALGAALGTWLGRYVSPSHHPGVPHA